MERYVVPQIEYEGKIIGFLTVKQAVVLGVAFLVIFLAFLIRVPILFLVFVIIFLGGGAFATAFVKIEGKPFLEFLKSSFNFIFITKRYVWQKKVVMPRLVMKTIEIKEEEEPQLKVERRKGSLGTLNTKLKTLIT